MTNLSQHHRQEHHRLRRPGRHLLRCRALRDARRGLLHGRRPVDQGLPGPRHPLPDDLDLHARQGGARHAGGQHRHPPPRPGPPRQGPGPARPLQVRDRRTTTLPGGSGSGLHASGIAQLGARSARGSGGPRSAAGSAGCPRRCRGSWSRATTSPAARPRCSRAMPASSTHESVMSEPTRPAFALAIEASSELGLRLSAIQAACRVSSWAPSQSASSWRNVAAAADCTWAGPVVVDLDAGLLEQVAGQVERGPGAAHGHRRDQRPGVVEGRHRAGEALLDVDLRRAEEVLGRHPAVGEGDRRGVGGADAELVLEPLHLHAGVVLARPRTT